MRELKGSEMILMPRQIQRRETSTPPKIEMTEFLVRIAGFFLARAMPIEGIAPFGLAFLAMEQKGCGKSLFTLLMVTLGYLSLAQGELFLYIGACVAYEALLFLGKEKREESKKFSLIAVALVTVFFDLIKMFWRGIGLGMLLKTLLDGALAVLGVVVFDRCRGFMKGKTFFHKVPSGEEKVAFCAMTGIGLLSFQGLPLPFSIAHILGFVLLGITGISGGVLAGTVFGIGVGFLLGLREELLVCLAVFTCCGFACGMLFRLGKLGVAASLGVVGGALSVYAIGTGSQAIAVYEALFAAVILAVLPGNILGAAGRFFDLGMDDMDGDFLFREQTQDRLAVAADAFANLAETFARISDCQNQADVKELAGMVEMMADRVCRSCSRSKECWQKNFHATYQTMVRFLEIMERKGFLEREDIGEYVSGRCLRQEALFQECNRLFEIHKINQVWNSKLCENRELVRQQFHGVAETLRRISGELDGVTRFDALAAEEIYCRLKNKGFEGKEVRVLQADGGRRSVQIWGEPLPRKEQMHSIEGVLKSVLGTEFTAADPQTDKNKGMLRFYEVPRFQVCVGFSTGCIRGENGDSHSLGPLSDGKYLAALSDGMGRGRDANRESGALVELLEHFMEAGFDKAVAVKLINSVLVMKSAREAFATVDMCMIDLHSGEAEFIKNGAEPSYIKRCARTEVVRSASLPVGMMPRVEVERFAHRLHQGDIVVMASDGLKMKKGHEGWLRHSIDSAEAEIPAQELADRIMEKALALKGGIADDDMTVLVLRIE